MNRDIRLLIVDDNVATRYALRKRLERHGYDVLEAGTGTDGLALIESEAIDALILDVNLPDMSGFDIVRILRADTRTALLPVIHASAASIQTADTTTGLNAAADDLIHPVDRRAACNFAHATGVRETEMLSRERGRFREISSMCPPHCGAGCKLKVHDATRVHQLFWITAIAALSECFADDQDAILDERACPGRWRALERHAEHARAGRDSRNRIADFAVPPRPS